MVFGYFTLLVALTISAVAEFYSIVGLTAIFSAAFWPIVIMGASLGVGKITGAVWLKLNWERASWTYKLYLVPAVAFLMVLTSMGIFGFLSKAHSDQNLVSGDSMAKVAIYDEKISTAKDNIALARKALKQMDDAVDQVMGRSDDEKGADKAVAIRRGQSKERARLLAEIEVEQKKVAQLSEERAPYATEFRRIENEVGPIKYIAALIYGDNPDANILERAVRWVIILIVAVFDPLALVLILAAQQSLRWAREEQQEKQDIEQFVDDAAQELLKDIDLQEAKVAEPEKSIFEKHPYLLKPFSHFKGTTPVVYKPEPKPEIYSGNPADFQEPWPEEKKQELVEAMQGFFDKNKENKILAAGVDEVERPGDYLVPPDHDDDEEEDDHIKAAIKKWKSLNPNDTIKNQRYKLMRGEITELPWMGLIADNVQGNETHTGFGAEFPATAGRGDTFVRVDQFPNVVYKYNGSNWIEVDKNLTDSYTYDTAYIDHLIEHIARGEYDIDLLSETEREQITERLNQINTNT